MVWLAIRRIIRNPIPGICVALFAAVLSIVLCVIHLSSLTAQEDYQKIYHQIDVTCTVTNLTGSNSDGLYLTNWMIGLFTGDIDGIPTGISELVTDVQLKGSHPIHGELFQYTLVGITSTQMAEELWPENGCSICWEEGFDESIFSKDERVCIIPQSLAKDYLEGTLALTLRPTNEDGEVFDGSLQIVGTYESEVDKSIYCSWETLVAIWRIMGQAEVASALNAKLSNNNDLHTLRTVSLAYFDVPDPNENPDAFGKYALDINDVQLLQADQALRNSLQTNKIFAVLILILSAFSGFLIGFLMIRNRKFEIALMRTMGTPKRSIYFGMVSEQMLCVLVGIILGGTINMWNPMKHLVVLAAIYFVGLTMALVLFLRSNLLAMIKEDK